MKCIMVMFSLSRMEGVEFEYLRWKLTANGDDDDDDGTETPRPSLPSMRYLAKSLFRQRTQRYLQPHSLSLSHSLSLTTVIIIMIGIHHKSIR